MSLAPTMSAPDPKKGLVEEAQRVRQNIITVIGREK
jgi:hypothetical protein